MIEQMHVTQLDHLVLTVQNIDESAAFYQSVLGMKKIIFGDNRVALRFGHQKINLHEYGNEFEPRAQQTMPGSADLCFITPVVLEQAMAEVEKAGVEIIAGPVKRSGANGPIRSFYFRDPDQNLIEIANEYPNERQQ